MSNTKRANVCSAIERFVSSVDAFMKYASVVCLFTIFLLYSADGRKTGEWPVYGGSPGSLRYSNLKQINQVNVRQLQIAWTFDAGDGAGGLETNPIIVDGILYANTPKHKVFALNAATGEQHWMFDPGIAGRGPNRGVTYWSDGSDKRIFAAVQQYLYALDAGTGKPIPAFGKEGRIDMRENLGRDPEKQSVVLTSPGIIYKDLLIIGGRDAESLPASPGDVRAYDVRNGKLRWSFHTIPHPGEFGYDTWPKDAWTYIGAANNWAGMSLDEARGIVFVPTGSAASDFVGTNRVGDNLFANSLIALKAETGERLWHFQAVKHDLWDRDFPSPPSLVTVKRDGRTVDAVAQTTKSGYVFLFDRTNGKPLFQIEYRKYPPSTVPGEVAAETQPLPTKPAPFARQLLTEDMLTNRTPEAHQAVLEAFRKLRSEGQFIPPGVGKETVVFPGFDGGAEWGGPAFDPETGLLYVNANEMAWLAALAETPPPGTETNGRQLYLKECASCHRDDRTGVPPQFPSLIGVGDRLSQSDVRSIIFQGGGRMPSFATLSPDVIRAVVQYVTLGEEKIVVPASTVASPIDQPYRFTGHHKFLDPDGYPAIAPPWGTLSAINLNTGEYAWKIPLGEIPELAEKGMKNTGSENYGGPIVTAGGLVFIGATNFDKKFRAFNKKTGQLLWETTLPFAGNATPATYEIDRRQFIVIAASGSKGGEFEPNPRRVQRGAIYVAFALPTEVVSSKQIVPK
jgi:quinoprotein glucose dehydrogenase